MSELTDRLKKAVEFDNKMATEAADNHRSYHARQSEHQAIRSMNTFLIGASFENTRLQPILTALIEAVGALEFYNDHHQFSDGTQMTAGQFRDMDDYGAVAREALSRLEKELGGGDET